ncbi:MAG: Peptidyl-prolyl cis-trans isomerase A precursor [Syntrophaceae bacterium PtaB.Bin038]|nr:MAG: Peptidyl-prolyl cis-trans isomerase A precursor [Syntrophaceae bacterium PtaB.Bin038]
MKRILWIVAALSLLAATALAEDKGKGNPTVVIKTSKGEIEAVLYRDRAPITVDNFLRYIEDGFYSGTIFHRVISGFMIQGGGFNRYYSRKATRPPIKNEAANGLKNERGTLAMARTPEVDSATAQFFINVVDNVPLDHGVRDYGYAVFGRVTKGMDVVDAIASVPTGAQGPFSSDCPRSPVIIESIRLK